MLRASLAGLIVSIAASTAFAADLPSRKGAVAPPPASTSCKETSATALSTDVFGFSTGSDVSDVGAWGAGLTYVGAFKGAGFKPGSFAAHGAQLQAATAFLPCWELGPYVVGAVSEGSWRGVPGSVNMGFYGIGIEQKYKLLGRATHGVGLTLDWDVNYQGYNFKDTTLAPILSYSGGQVTSSYRLFLDKELVAGKLFGAINLAWDQIWFERPAIITPTASGDYLRQSNLTASAALTYQVVDGLYVGGEARYVRNYLGNFFNQFVGDAAYVGPTFYWQATKSLAISGAYGVQVAGSAKAIAPAVLAPQFAASNLNLATQNQHIAKLKIAYSF